jgi:tetratricopeptide (TPR) repeat protein
MKTKLTAFSLFMMASIVLQSCASINQYAAKNEELDQFVSNKPAQLQAYFRTLYNEGERNSVLNFDRLGLAAMKSGHYDIASTAFDQSILRIQKIYANNPDAEKARSLWNAEEVKDFKGEPHERAMTYYYRGLLYFREGDLDNARASFKAASLQSKWAEDKQYDANFGMMDFLGGWTSMCIGDESGAQESFQYASKVHPPGAFDDFIAHPSQSISIYEDGFAPAKVRFGKHGEIMKFNDNLPVILPPQSGVMIGDVSYQATTRGGRAIDGINKGKAHFKDNAETTANVSGAVAQAGMFTALSGAASNNSALQSAGSIVGGAGALVSLFSSAVAKNTEPAADIRAWELLPARIYLVPENSVRWDGDGFAEMKASQAKCNLQWIRYTPSPAPVVESSNLNKKVDFDSSRGPRNLEFRQGLKSLFGG